MINNLVVLRLSNEPTIIVYWTSSDDFTTAGYEIGYSTEPINPDNWGSVERVEGIFNKGYHEDIPDNGYVKIDNLLLSTPYYFAVKAYDADGNYTELSNNVNAITTDSIKSWDSSSFNEMTNNSWLNLNPDLPPGSTSQVFLAYDAEKDKLMTWGGHLVSGGYPQVDEIYTYNINDLAQENTWKIEDINFSNSSDKPVGGCCTGGTYDVGNKVMFKRGQHRVDAYEYYRKSNLEGWPWIYDPAQYKWFDMKAFDYMSGGNDGAGVTYDSNNQIVLILDSKHDNYHRTAVYDAYTNKVTRIRINSWVALGGKRSDMGLVYDSKRNRFIVVGGVLLGAEGIRSRHTDVWTFDLTDKKWLEEEGVINSEILPTSGWTASDATYDSINDKVILLLGFNVSGKKNFDGRYLLAFAYDLGTKTWEKLPEKPGHFVGGRPMDLNVIFSEKHNAVLTLESARPSYAGQGLYSETWAYRYSTDIPPQTKPSTPKNILLETTQDSAVLTWDLDDNQNVINYNIFRGQAEDPWDAQYSKIDTIPSSLSEYIDTSIIPGTTYFYYVTATDNQGIDSDSSLKVRTQPPVIREGYVSIQNSAQTKVVWTLGNKDIVGYNVYRTECDFEIYPVNESLNIPGDLAKYTKPTIKRITKPSEADYVKINSDLVTASEYEDNVNLINSDESATYPYKVYAYRIKAVNSLGVESGWSPYWLTIPDSPTGLYINKDDTNFYLSWTAPNDGIGIKRYRIYLASGRTGSAREITDEQTEGDISLTHRVIPKTEDLGRWQRFHVTAIDDLDQEGSPSAGMWGDRIYGSVYDAYYTEVEADIPGDLNNDGVFDHNDYVSFITTLGTSVTDSEYNSVADNNNDGKVSYSDFVEWYNYFKSY